MVLMEPSNIVECIHDSVKDFRIKKNYEHLNLVCVVLSLLMIDIQSSSPVEFILALNVPQSSVK